VVNIFINRRPVGTLSREEPLNRFAYDGQAEEGQAVSLLMPVTGETYLAERSGALHPIFDMSLPEGALREAISTLFAKVLPAFDDFALYQIVGRSAIGRLRCGESAERLDQVPPLNLRTS
jgi:serine/threonine-protein kinase HipA